jgi:hypothetical protein
LSHQKIELLTKIALDKANEDKRKEKIKNDCNVVQVKKFQ